VNTKNANGPEGLLGEAVEVVRRYIETPDDFARWLAERPDRSFGVTYDRFGLYPGVRHAAQAYLEDRLRPTAPQARITVTPEAIYVAVSTSRYESVRLDAPKWLQRFMEWANRRVDIHGSYDALEAARRLGAVPDDPTPPVRTPGAGGLAPAPAPSGGDPGFPPVGGFGFPTGGFFSEP